MTEYKMQRRVTFATGLWAKAAERAMTAEQKLRANQPETDEKYDWRSIGL